MRLGKLLLTLFIGVISLSACATPTEPPKEALSPLAQDLSAQIAGIDIAETTALTSLYRISKELDEVRSDGSLTEEVEAKLRADLMERFTDWVNTREDRLCLSTLSPPIQGQITWTNQEIALLEEAEERIERYRQGDATLLVVDSAGAPVTGAVVYMDMLKHDFLFGGWRVGPPTLDQSQAYCDAFAQLFNYATLPFFWDSYESVQGHERQESLMNMALWARDRGMTIKGHPLIFPTFPVPDWANELSPEQMDEVLRERVTRIVGNFRGLIDYWDVLNEPTTIGAYREPLRSWMLTHTPAGAEARVLEWARNANPEANLLVNDWRNDYSYHIILEDIVAAGTRFDAIGLQSYMYSGTWTLDQVWDTCERFKDFNLPLHFTEVEVPSGDFRTDFIWGSDNPGWDTTPEGEAIQGEYVPALYTILFSHPSMQAISWVDLSDLFDVLWGAPGGLLRKDMSPKPVYERLMELIHQEWWTNGEAKTNEQGEAIIRGFYGQYLLTVTSGEQSVQKLIHLKPEQENIFEVQLP
jgi:endo-1,4-beta-xylanase